MRKCIITSIFSFFHNVIIFQKVSPSEFFNLGLCGEKLNVTILKTVVVKREGISFGSKEGHLLEDEHIIIWSILKSHTIVTAWTEADLIFIYGKVNKCYTKDRRGTYISFGTVCVPTYPILSCSQTMSFTK